MSESDEDLGFRINKSYAEKYDTWRRKEEYQKLKDKYGEDVLESSSSSEIEDDDAQEITPLFEKQFLRALASVKSRDPKIYDKGVKFFDDEEHKSKEDSADGDQKSRQKKGKEKPMYLKDYERKIIVEKGGKFSDDEEDVDDNFDEGRSASPSYMEEQEQIKDSFRDALKDVYDSSDDDTFLTKKKKTKEEKEQEEEDYIQWLKGERQELTKEDVLKETKDLDSLRDYWSNPQLDDGEKFLRDFILDKAYKPNGNENEFENLSDEDLSEDDRLLDEQEDFERKYNFRFEEPDSEFVRSYPRNIEGSMRRKDTSRAKKRQEVKERKEKEKQKLREELKKLKNLKKMEILEQLEKLKKVTGNTVVGFDEEDMKGDFDPNQHDEMMKKVFSEEYDELDEDKTKPVFDDDEDFEEENWDEWTGYDDGYYEGGENADGSQPHCEDPGFIMDADYDPELHKKEKKKKKKKDKKEKKGEEADESTSERSRNDLDGRRPRNKHASEFAKALQNEKPVFDPEDETFEEYFDEYYKLDYEDLIGDLPCRFKYRTVVANDFGLTPEEVLGADDKELNRWVSLKKACQYRTKNEELSDLHSFKEKGRNIYKKKQIFQSLYQPREDEEQEGEVDEEETAVEEEEGNYREGAGEEHVSEKDQSLESSNEKKKKKKKKKEKEKEDKEMDQNRDSGDVERTVKSTTNVSTTGEGERETNGQVRGNERVQMEKGEGENRREVVEQGPSRTKGAGKRKFMEELRERKRRKMARKKEISEGRLKAYGVKPKAYKYKMIQNRIRDKRMKKVR